MPCLRQRSAKASKSDVSAVMSVRMNCTIVADGTCALVERFTVHVRVSYAVESVKPHSLAIASVTMEVSDVSH